MEGIITIRIASTPSLSQTAGEDLCPELTTMVTRTATQLSLSLEVGHGSASVVQQETNSLTAALRNAQLVALV